MTGLQVDSQPSHISTTLNRHEFRYVVDSQRNSAADRDYTVAEARGQK